MAYSFSSPIARPHLTDGTELPPGRHIINHSQIPGSWFAGDNLSGMLWNGQKLRLPKDLHGTLLTLRGNDIPVFPSAKALKGATFPFQKKRGSLIINSRTGVKKVYGRPGAIFDEHGSFYWSIQSHSQLPTLTCFYQRMVKGKPIVHRVTLHGSKLFESVEHHSPEFIKAGGLPFKLPEFELEAAQGLLYGVTLKFGKNVLADRNGTCVTVSYDSDEYNARWASDAAMMETLKGEQNTTEGFDEAVWSFFRASECTATFLRVATPMDLPRLPAFDLQFQHWVDLMRLTIKYGPFWFYSMQDEFAPLAPPGSQLIAWSDPDSPPPVPFWLVTKATVVVTATGLTHVLPVEWQPILPDVSNPRHRFWRLPNDALVAFVHELAILRLKAFEHVAPTAFITDEVERPMVLLNSMAANEVSPMLSRSLIQEREREPCVQQDTLRERDGPEIEVVISVTGREEAVVRAIKTIAEAFAQL